MVLGPGGMAAGEKNKVQDEIMRNGKGNKRKLHSKRGKGPMYYKLYE